MIVDQLIDLLALTPTPSPSSGSVAGGGGGSGGSGTPSWVPYATSAIAIAAALVALVVGLLQRRSGREAAAAARESAAAANVSSEAAQRSAKAAEDSVELNTATATRSAVRLDAEGLAKRYQDGAAQLGHSSAAVRLAGVYAMARLADDWADQRQTCVDVLCSYVRMPWEGIESGYERSEEAEIRRTILAVIGTRVQDGVEISWSNLVFDFRRAQLPDFSWSKAIFGRQVMFQRAHFGAGVRFAGCLFHEGATFAQTTISKHLSLDEVSVEDGFLNFQQAIVTKEAGLGVSLLNLGENARLNLAAVQCAGRISVDARPWPFAQGRILLPGMILGRASRLEVEVVDPILSSRDAGCLPALEHATLSISKSATINIDARFGEHQINVVDDPPEESIPSS